MDSFSYPYYLISLGVLAGVLIGFFLRKRFVEGNEKNIRIQSKQIVETAIVEAEQIKKEALLQSKEAAYQVKKALEEELKIERDELKDERKQFKKRGDRLKQEWENFDRRQQELHSDEKRLKQVEREWLEKHKEADNLIGKQRYELSRLAGLSQEEAKKMLMDSLESEARMDAAKRLAKIENEMKIEAARKGKNILALAIFGRLQKEHEF